MGTNELPMLCSIQFWLKINRLELNQDQTNPHDATRGINSSRNKSKLKHSCHFPQTQTVSELYCIHFIKNLFLPAGRDDVSADNFALTYFVSVNLARTDQVQTPPLPLCSSRRSLRSPLPRRDATTWCQAWLDISINHTYEPEAWVEGSDVARAVIMVSESQSSPASATSLYQRRRTFSEQK